MMNINKLLCGVLLATSLTLTGCAEGNQYTSSEQIVEELLAQHEQSKAPKSFYQESVTVTYENKKVINDDTIKVWHDYESGRFRYEISTENSPVRYTVFDGKERILYSEGDKNAIVMDPPSTQVDQPNSFIDAFIQGLHNIAKTHEITLVGEEKMDGISTFHLKATAKDPKAIVGNQEFWVDQEKWIMKKIISEFGNTRQETLIKDYHMNVEITDDLFTLDLPNDVKLVKDEQPPTLTLEEAQSLLDQSFYYYPNTEAVQMLPITKQEDGSIHVSYMKDGVTYFILMIERMDDSDKGKITGEYQIHGNNARILEGEYGIGDSLKWEEGQLRYTITDIGNVLKKDEIKKIADQMIKTSK